MSRIKWAADPVAYSNGFHGQCGMLRYQISPPKMTPGWRVWCMLHDPKSIVSSSVGGLIVTMKAPDLDAAKAAAEQHLAELVKGLIGEPVAWTTLADLTDLQMFGRSDSVKMWPQPSSMANIPLYTKPEQPDTPGA